MKKLYFLFIALSLHFYSIAQFNQTNGPALTGQCQALYAGGDLIMAAIGTDLYRSSDNGTNWELITIEEGVVNIDPRLILRIGDTFICATNNGDRIYRSIDLGLTWTPSWTGAPDIAGFPAAVVLDGTTIGPNFIIYGTNLLRISTDDGLTWTSFTGINSGAGEGFADLNGTWWLGQGNYTGYSTNNGATWTQTATMPHVGFGLSATDFVLIGDRTYCGTSSSGSMALRYTTDNGTTWVPVGGFSIIEDMAYIDGVFYIYDYYGMHRSFDDGATWENFLSVSQPAYGASFTKNGDDLWVSTNGGPLKYNLTTGTSASPNINSASTSWILVGTDYTFTGVGNTIFVSADDGNSWQNVALPSYAAAWGNITYATMDGNTLYIIHNQINNDVGMIMTSDGGATWEVMDLGDFGGNNPAAFLSFNPQIMITSEWFVINYYYSNDDGETFVPATITAAAGSTLPSSYSVSGIYKVGARLFAQLNNGHAISNDNGQSWTYVDPGFELTSFAGWDSRIVAIENAWTGKRIHYSMDGGLTWTQDNLGFPTHADGKINPVAMTTIDGVVYAQNNPLDNTVANPYSIYTLSPSGNWQAANELGNVGVPITGFGGTSINNLWISTQGASVWKTSGSVGLEEMILPTVKVYPNPTKGMLTIENIPSTVKHLEIFNSTGQMMLQQNVNQTKIDIDLSGFPNGVYFVKCGGVVRVIVD